MKLTFFTGPECTLCDAAWFVVEKVARAQEVPVKKIDISAPEAAEWHARYRHDIPVLHLNGVEVCRHRVNERQLRAWIRDARRVDRA